MTVACGVAIMMLSSLGAPQRHVSAAPLPATELAESAVGIVLGRCSMCHAAEPFWPGIGVAPKGVRLETHEDMVAHKDAIRATAVLTHFMPPGNVSEITPEERETLAAWLATLQ